MDHGILTFCRYLSIKLLLYRTQATHCNAYYGVSCACPSFPVSYLIKVNSACMAVSIYHGILTLCRCLIINSYIAQATPCDTESCMFPYLILSRCDTCIIFYCPQLRTNLVMHNSLHNQRLSTYVLSHLY